MNVLKLISPIPPSVNHYTKSRGIKRGNKISSFVYSTNEAKTYKKDFGEYVKEEVVKQNFIKSDDKYRQYDVYMTCYFNRIDMDPQNYDKCMLDAITESKSVWFDDNIVALKVDRIYYDRKNPRIELSIKIREHIGIFNNEEDMILFENKCKSCNRYNRNCKILNQAKHGFIQDDVIERTCIKYKKRKG